MASSTAPSFNLEEYCQLSWQKAFALEVTVHVGFPLRGLIDGAQSAVTPGQLLLIGVPIAGIDTFQVAIKDDGRFLLAATGADLRRCVAPTETTKALASGRLVRVLQPGPQYESLQQLTQSLKCRNLLGEVKTLLPGTYLHSGESSLAPNHVILTQHQPNPTPQNAQPHIITSRQTQITLFQSWVLIAATGRPVPLDNQVHDLTAGDDTQEQQYVAWEPFEGCGTTCGSVLVEKMEEVTVFCKSATSSTLWCRNAAGNVFIHDPPTPLQVKLVKVTPPGQLNVELEGRLQGIFDWPQQKFEDYRKACEEMEREEGPHPLTLGSHRQCHQCQRWFGRHSYDCNVQTWVMGPAGQMR